MNSEIYMQKVVCRYYAKGSCKEPDCPFPHVTEKGRTPDSACRFYLRGNCRFDAYCNNDHIFVHVKNDWSKRMGIAESEYEAKKQLSEPKKKENKLHSSSLASKGLFDGVESTNRSVGTGIIQSEVKVDENNPQLTEMLESVHIDKQTENLDSYSTRTTAVDTPAMLTTTKGEWTELTPREEGNILKAGDQYKETTAVREEYPKNVQRYPQEAIHHRNPEGTLVPSSADMLSVARDIHNFNIPFSNITVYAPEGSRSPLPLYRRGANSSEPAISAEETSDNKMIGEDITVSQQSVLSEQFKDIPSKISRSGHQKKLQSLREAWDNYIPSEMSRSEQQNIDQIVREIWDNYIPHEMSRSEHQNIDLTPRQAWYNYIPSEMHRSEHQNMRQAWYYNNPSEVSGSAYQKFDQITKQAWDNYKECKIH